MHRTSKEYNQQEHTLDLYWGVGVSIIKRFNVHPAVMHITQRKFFVIVIIYTITIFYKFIFIIITIIAIVIVIITSIS